MLTIQTFASFNSTRGIEHRNDIAACKTSSHMLRHLLDVHEHEEAEWDNINFGMRIVKNTRTAFKRQIYESVLIQQSRLHYLMNSKSEYNRCAIPRLTTKMGEKDLEKWRVKDRLEMEKEATIEEKIRVRKKAKAKDRGEANRRREAGQPAKKKMRLQDQCQVDNMPDQKERERREIEKTTPSKRKCQLEKGRSPKKARKTYNIRDYYTCKKWRGESSEQHTMETAKGQQLPSIDDHQGT